MKFIQGKTYPWREILTGVNAVAGPPYYLLRHRKTGKVVAACLVTKVNPRAPYEIIPAKGAIVRHWADAYCKQQSALDVFVQEADKQWYYRGQFRYAGESNDPNEIKLRAIQANRRNLHKIIFLKEVDR